MHKRFFTFTTTIIISAVAGFLFSALSARANLVEDVLKFIAPSRETRITEKIAPSYEAPVEYENAIINAVQQASPGVISIIISKDLPVIEKCPYNPFSDLPPEFREFFGSFELERPCTTGTRKQEVGGGSGFVVSEQGLIVTNKHVVADNDAEYTVLTNDGKKYPAKVLARDPIQDIAIVKISPTENLPVLKLGNSDGVKLGQTAIAIGNALGEFRNTVSVGIISGLARAITASGGEGDVERLEGLIQTDAAINPGNSGGPLLNLRGEVIGINTAVAAGAENIGFAIPINKVKRDINSVEKNGKITAAFLGVRYLIVTDALQERESLGSDYGVLLRGNEDGPAVVPDSPAARAELQAEDIILSIDGEKITPENPLTAIIARRDAGDRIVLKVLRGSAKIDITVVLGEREL
jgi:serine protease Do